MLSISLSRWFSWFSLISISITIVGCGTGDGPTSVSDSVHTGVLLDGPTSGVSYTTDTQTGTTNANGEFKYFSGESIVFWIGGIKLGEVQLEIPDPDVASVAVTPVELTGSTDASDPNVIRLLQLLQSLDSDGDHSNGITISAATVTAAASYVIDFADPDFEVNNPAFDLQSIVDDISDPNDPVPLIVTAGEALENFIETIEDYSLNISVTATYQLVWADEFNEAVLNSDDWNIETGYGPNNAGWGNDEWQEYTANSENIQIVFEDDSDTTNGYLKISALCPSPGVDNVDCQQRDGSITSGKINTKGKQEFQYGKIEARMRVPTGKGSWPAFWSLGASYPDTPWPAAGEMDFMEVFNNANGDTKDALFTIHWEQTDEQADHQYTTESRAIDGGEFHVFEAIWDEEKIIGMVDGITYASYTFNTSTQSEFNNPFYLILNLAMGGNPVANPDATTTWPQEMMVDYVRVYQAVGDFGASVLDIGFEGASEFKCFYDGGEDCGAASGFAGADVSIQPNPDTVGNSSASAARFLKFNPSNGELFSGTIVELNDELTSYLDQSNKIFTMKVWSSRAVTLDFVLQTTPGNGPSKIVTTDGSGWQEFAFDFSADDMTGVTALVLIFGNGETYEGGDAQDDLDSGSTQWTFYFDDIVLQAIGEDGGDTEPTVAAPTPTEDAGNVISIFSDDYTDVTGVDYNPAWGQATVYTLESIATNDTLKYASINYQGIDFTGNAQDVSGMDTVHIDFWTPDATAVNLYLISSGPVEAAYALPIITGGWQSVDIPLSSFSGVDLADVTQMKFDDNGTGEGATIFIDNLYFYTTGSGGGGTGILANGDFEGGDFTGWTQSPDGGSITLDTSEQGGRTGAVARLVANGSVAGGAQDVLLSQVGLMEIDTVSISGGDSVTVSVDVFGSLSGAGGVVFIELISRDSADNETGRSFIGTAPITPTTTWTTYSSTVNIAADVSGGITLQLKSSCGAIDGCGVDASFDNVTIVAAGGGGGGGSAPSDAPTAPTASNTISVYSDAYTDITGVDYNPGWGQATVYSTESIANNNVIKLAGLNYQGIDFSGNAQDVSGLDTLHIDYWTADSTAFNFYLVSPGPAETAYAVTPTTGSWQSLDIPLSSFSGVDLADVIQMKLGEGNGTVYLDNLYFYTASSNTSCVASGGELTINGNFEAGDVSCWEDFSAANNGTFAASSASNNGGAWSGNLVASGAGSFPVVKQANMGIGTVTANTSMTISFDLYGTVTGTGGVVFAEFFSELSGGGTSANVMLSGGAHPVPSTWTTYSYTTTTGNDVSGGVTLQLKTDCGSNAGCTVDVFFDNVSVTVTP